MENVLQKWGSSGFRDENHQPSRAGGLGACSSRKIWNCWPPESASEAFVSDFLSFMYIHLKSEGTQSPPFLHLCLYDVFVGIIAHSRNQTSHAPQLRSCNCLIAPWPPLIIGLTYDHPHPSDSRQFAYKKKKNFAIRGIIPLVEDFDQIPAPCGTSVTTSGTFKITV